MHVEKYEKSAVGHMLRHYNRTAQNIGNRILIQAVPA